MSDSNAEECWRLNRRSSRRSTNASSSRSDSIVLILGQLDHGHVEGGERRGGVEVAAFLRLSVEDGPAPFELGDFAQLDQVPRARSCERCRAPR